MFATPTVAQCNIVIFEWWFSCVKLAQKKEGKGEKNIFFLIFSPQKVAQTIFASTSLATP